MTTSEGKVRFGKCVIDQEIGRGARSIVYLAMHEGLQIPVAVKVMKKEYGRDEDQFSERFTREARIAAQLTHTNIVRVYDCGETDAAYYLVLEYIEGESCRDKMEQWGAFDWQRAVQIVRAVADGLYYAAKKGIIHRDLKPENIMIDTEGGAHLADLGLAKEVLPGESSTTADGDVLGTPYYMSPEQVRQPSDVDFRSDMYSLGATLYHMATGEVPFEAPTPFEIMTKHLNEPLIPPGKIRPDLPDRLCAIIERLMKKDPDDRYEDYEELIDELDALLAGKEAAEPSETEENRQLLEALRREQEQEEGQEAPPADQRPDSAATDAVKRRPPEPEAQPMRPVELPVNDVAVGTKLTGLFAVGMYALTLLATAFALQHTLAEQNAGVALSMLTVLMVVLAAAGYGVLLLRGSVTSASGESTLTLNDKLSRALTRLCTRFDLPAPIIHDTGRTDDACSAYSFFSRKAALYVPNDWMHSAGLSDRECEAMLAHGLAGVYTGDSNLRLILSLPLGVLRLQRWLLSRLFRSDLTGPHRLKKRTARVLGLAGIAVCCIIVALAFVWMWQAGLIVTAVFATLMAVAAYERHLCSQCDRLALRALDSEDAVQDMIVAVGLSGLRTYRTAAEVSGTDLAPDWHGAPVEAGRRASLGTTLAGHFREREHLPDTLGLAGTAFALQPSLPQRLNKLSGVAPGSGYLTDAVDGLRRMYATLMGVDENDVCTHSELANMSHYVLLGVLAGFLALFLLSLFAFRNTPMEWVFAPVLAVLGVALGVAVVPRSTRRGPRPGRVGYATVLASMAMSITLGVGITLAFWGEPPLYGFSAMVATAFVPLLLVTGTAAALFVRLSPTMGAETGPADVDEGSKTAHTVMMLLKEKENGNTPSEPTRANGGKHSSE